MGKDWTHIDLVERVRAVHQAFNSDDSRKAAAIQLAKDVEAALVAAREEGRREGYAQANLEKAKRPSSEGELTRMRALEAQWREGYAACTADVAAWAKMEATSRAEAAYECIAEDIERGEHVGAAELIRETVRRNNG